MRIEINTEEKTIIIKERVCLKDVLNFCEKHNINLKKHDLISDTEYSYYPYIPYVYDTYDFNDYVVTCGTLTHN